MEAIEIKHSAIGASSRHRWRECPGSVKLCTGLPPTSNVYAETGTHFHGVVADILNDPWKRAYYEMVEDPEHLKAALSYVDFIRAECASATLLRIEYPFEMGSLFPGLFGTCDAYAYFLKEKILRVYDYKHGSGHFVEVEENDQLIYYGLGALLELPFPVDHVELVIVQPRCPRKGNVIHKWIFPITEIYGQISDLVNEAKATEEPNAPLKTGAWCYFCPAVSFCPQKHAERNEKAREQFAEFAPVVVQNNKEKT